MIIEANIYILYFSFAIDLIYQSSLYFSKVYDTGRLFIKLMTPTFFVIVTIIQVHYFHKDFLELSDIEEK